MARAGRAKAARAAAAAQINAEKIQNLPVQNVDSVEQHTMVAFALGQMRSAMGLVLSAAVMIRRDPLEVLVDMLLDCGDLGANLSRAARAGIDRMRATVNGPSPFNVAVGPLPFPATGVAMGHVNGRLWMDSAPPTTPRAEHPTGHMINPQRAAHSQLCTTCGNAGHVKKDCPLAPKKDDNKIVKRQIKEKQAGEGLLMLRAVRRVQNADSVKQGDVREVLKVIKKEDMQNEAATAPRAPAATKQAPAGQAGSNCTKQVVQVEHMLASDTPAATNRGVAVPADGSETAQTGSVTPMLAFNSRVGITNPSGNEEMEVDSKTDKQTPIEHPIPVSNRAPSSMEHLLTQFEALIKQGY